MLIMGDSSLYDNVENRQDVIGKKLPIDLPGVEGISQQLLDKLEVAIYTCDSRGYITHYNKAAAAVWGTEPEIGKDLWCGSWRIYKPDGITPLPLDECPMAVALKEGRPVNGQEIIIERPNGERS